MKNNEKWIVLAFTGFSSKHNYKVLFLDSIQEVEKELENLQDQRTPSTNQSYLEFSMVFKPNSLYPTTFEAFEKEVERRRLESDYFCDSRGSLFIQYKNKKGSLFQKEYEWSEDLQLRLQTCEEKGITDIILLKTGEARSADTFYRWDLPELKQTV